MYERVATPLANSAGMGRIGDLPSPMMRQQLADHVKRALGLPNVMVVAPNQLGATAGKSSDMTLAHVYVAVFHGQSLASVEHGGMRAIRTNSNV